MHKQTLTAHPWEERATVLTSGPRCLLIWSSQETLHGTVFTHTYAHLRKECVSRKILAANDGLSRHVNHMYVNYVYAKEDYAHSAQAGTGKFVSQDRPPCSCVAATAVRKCRMTGACLKNKSFRDED